MADETKDTQASAPGESPREEVKTVADTPSPGTTLPGAPSPTPAGEGASSTPPEPEKIPEEPRDEIIKIDGREYAMTRSEARKFAQIGLAGQKRFAEVARERQALEEERKALREEKNLGAVLERRFLADAGGNRELAQRNLKDFLARNLGGIIQEDEAPPEVKEQMRRERAIGEREKALQDRERAIEKAAEDRRQVEEEGRLAREIPVALKSVGLASDLLNQEMVMRLAMQAEASGNREYTIDQAATELKLYTDVNVGARIDSMDGEQVERLHPAFFKKVVEHYQKKIRAQASGASIPKPSTPQKDEEQAGRPGQALSLSEKRKAIEARIQSRFGG